MDFIGGILGQIIATLNVAVLVGAHLVVLMRDRKLKRIERQQAAESKKLKLREANFSKH